MADTPSLRRSLIDKLLPSSFKKASAPGTVQYVGRQTGEASVHIELLDYDAEALSEQVLDNVDAALPFKAKPTVTWLNITGLNDTTIIERLGETFDIHPLTLEDIADTTQRPKFEDYEDYFFIILKMAYYDEVKAELNIEQVSLIVGEDYVISFQENAGDVLESLRHRLRSNKRKARRLGSDYLAYGILDTITDHYFTILEQMGEDVDELEEKLLLSSDADQMVRSIYLLKQELMYLRRSIWPMREVLGSLLRIDHKLLSDSTKVYLRDVYDHTVRIVETVETFRDMTASMLDLYLSTVSNRMNEVMKVLTIFAAIFIPLTFITSLYGMNFQHMPELDWRWGYPAVLSFMLLMALSMLAYFNRKRWL